MKLGTSLKILWTLKVKSKNSMNNSMYTNLTTQVKWINSLKHNQSKLTQEDMNNLALPWWRSGWEPACRCGGCGFEPWSGRIPHAAEQLGPWATAAEPARLEPVLRSRRGRDGERPAHRDEEWPPLAAAGGAPPTEMRTQHSQE